MPTEDEKRMLAERKRNILFIISQYLTDYSLTSTNEQLIKETNLPIKQYQICDNIDLETMFLDYCSYYQLRFGKQPKFIRKIPESQTVVVALNNKKSANLKQKQQHFEMECCNISNGNLEITGKDAILDKNLSSTLTIVSPVINQSKMINDDLNTEDVMYNRPLKMYENCSPEWKEIAEIVCRDIVKKKPLTEWKHIKGHDNILSILNESVIMPLEYPNMFTGIIKPWKSILLHGPPGTGKTLLSRGLYAETRGKITFFNVSSTTIISKWRGDSEKYIRVLFEAAKFYQPSIIFIDEFDGLSSRRDAANEHEASKRFKNEFLIQIDDIDDVNVFLLANTNLPWEIDPAFLRRFEKKMLVGLPNDKDRWNIICNFLPHMKTTTNVEIIKNICEQTSGLTGDDLRIACKEVSMQKIRIAIKEKQKYNEQDFIKSITSNDLQQVFAQIVPTITKNLIEKHIKWNQTYGN